MIHSKNEEEKNLMALIPVNGQILVEIPKKEEGVYIPESLSDSMQEGVVIALAEDVKIVVNYNYENALKPGARVRWEKFAETDGTFDYGDKKAVLIDSNKITGVFV